MKGNFSIGIDARFILRPLRGMPLYVLRICQKLPSLNRNYRFFYFINKGFEHNDTPENYILRIQEIENNNPNVTFVNQDDEAEIKWEQVYLPKMIKQHQVNLLHMPGNRICFYPGVPTVVTVHDVMEYLYLSDKKNLISWSDFRKLRLLQHNLRKKLYILFTYHYAIKKSSKIITVSQSSAKEILTTLSPIKKDQISVIYHGIDDEYLDGSPLPFYKRRFTLMLGGDSIKKNPEAALTCWSKVSTELRKKYPLKIIGFCGSDSSPLIRTVKNLGLESSIDIQGWLSQEEVVYLFKHAALFLFPSRHEGFGFPLLQAMASGTPVISTTKASIPEVLGDVGYQCDPDDHDGMAAAANAILTSPSEWQKQSTAGHTRSYQFRWEQSARKHLNVYEEFL